MLAKKQRITKELFDVIMKEGFFISGSVFTLRYISKKPNQFAFVAPKGFAPKANIRNKLRRQGYAALRSYNPHQSIAGIFFYKKQANIPGYKSIQSDIETLLRKVK